MVAPPKSRLYGADRVVARDRGQPGRVPRIRGGLPLRKGWCIVSHEPRLGGPSAYHSNVKGSASVVCNDPRREVAADDPDESDSVPSSCTVDVIMTNTFPRLVGSRKG